MQDLSSNRDALRVVIDSSMLESDELRVFLSTSGRHRAVLTEYAWIEAYKQDPVQSITNRMMVLRDFPQQVLVLKGIRTIASLDARAPGLANRMIRRRGGAEFAGTMEALTQAQSGDPRVIDQILEHGRAAESQMAIVLTGVPDILAAMPEMQQQMFTDAEVRRARAGGGYSRHMVATILGAADQLTDTLFRMHPDHPKHPSKRSRVDTFFFRYSLATIIYTLSWMRRGSAVRRKHEKVRNDFIDLSFAALATYFNGLMSDDERARSFHNELRHVLGMLGARVPEDYVLVFLEKLRRRGL